MAAAKKGPETALLEESGELVPPGMVPPGKGYTVPLPTAPSAGPTPPFPILTEEVAYPPSPLASGGGTNARSGGTDRNGSSLGPVVSRALQQALGWKIKSGDAAGFTGALAQSFSLKVVEGAVVSSWTPRSYVVQSDLSGGVSGAQASIFTMAKTLVDQMQPLIDGLYALDPAADTETVAALKDLVRSQISNLGDEFGFLSGPRVMRVHQYFQMLFGIRLSLNHSPPAGQPSPELKITKQNPPPKSPLAKYFDQPTGARHWPPLNYWTNPDTVLGSLGDLRDELGLFETVVPSGEAFVNTVSDEQNVTNFRIIVDYANSLLNAWQTSIQYFANPTSPFLGTQLVVISRQLGVISETVDEVRFVFDSVFVGPAQRQTVQLLFHNLGPATLPAAVPLAPHVKSLPPIYLEDLLLWMQNFVGGEAQDAIQNGGKLGVGEDFVVMTGQIYTQAVGLYLLSLSSIAPIAAMATNRVQQSLYKLATQLGDFCTMAAAIGTPYIPARQ
ncbi:MAG: hypothetical protein WBF89_21755 [Steroidobacteraceae bacterium]